MDYTSLQLVFKYLNLQKLEKQARLLETLFSLYKTQFCKARRKGNIMGPCSIFYFHGKKDKAEFYWTSRYGFTKRSYRLLTCMLTQGRHYFQKNETITQHKCHYFLFFFLWTQLNKATVSCATHILAKHISRLVIQQSFAQSSVLPVLQIHSCSILLIISI